MKHSTVLVLGLILAASVALVGCAGTPRVAEAIDHAAAPASPANTEVNPTRPSDEPERPWAELVEKPGLPNFYRVSDTLYRGAQPTKAGVRELRALGVRMIVNLRSFHSDRDEIGDTDVGYEHIAMKAWHAEEEDIVRFLRIATDEKRTPVFVHCQHGADRTGLMVAVYRVVVQGWSKEEALREMTEGPYNFHGVWRNLKQFLRELDVEEIREKAGIRRP